MGTIPASSTPESTPGATDGGAEACPIVLLCGGCILARLQTRAARTLRGTVFSSSFLLFHCVVNASSCDARQARGGGCVVPQMQSLRSFLADSSTRFGELSLSGLMVAAWILIPIISGLEVDMLHANASIIRGPKHRGVKGPCVCTLGHLLGSWVLHYSPTTTSFEIVAHRWKACRHRICPWHT